MQELIFIGEYPASQGGITRKAEAIYNQLKNRYHIKYININVSKRKGFNVIKCLFLLVFLVNKKDKIIYVLDNKRLDVLLTTQKAVCPQSLKNTTVVISGYSSKDVLQRKRLLNVLNHVKAIWIEGDRMRLELQKYISSQYVYYPNPRIIGCSFKPVLFKKNSSLKLLYYSQISKEKGLYDVIQIVDTLNEKTNVKFDIDFYGYVKEDVIEDFNRFIANTSNAYYKGINNAKKVEDYYGTLNQYDIMIFHTHWECVAGVCVDAKIAGITIIADDHNFNSEVILENNDEGIIVSEGDNDKIVSEIIRLYENPDVLNRYKKGSYNSRQRYDIENYHELFQML